MTTPSGTIGLSDVNVELGFPSTTLITMNQSDVRTLAGVGGSGTVISMNDLRGKSNRVAIALTISSNTTDYNIYNNRGPTYSAGKSDVTLTIDSPATVYSTSTGTPALTVGSFTSGDTVTIVNNGIIVGKGGSGGNGGPGGGGYGVQNPGNPGVAAGPGFYTAYPVTFTNNNRIAGGGGGGGGGAGTDYCGSYPGGGGGGGTGNGPGGSRGPTTPTFNGNNGNPGSLTGGGNGGTLFGGGQPHGGSGGAYGSGGSPSTNAAIRPGGAAGNAIVGNSYITWLANGTKNGPIS